MKIHWDEWGWAFCRSWGCSLPTTKNPQLVTCGVCRLHLVKVKKLSIASEG